MEPVSTFGKVGLSFGLHQGLELPLSSWAAVDYFRDVLSSSGAQVVPNPGKEIEAVVMWVLA